jgi:hypothetical protein
MKCVKRLADGVISRMRDANAHYLVKEYSDKFAYAPKNEWKSQAKSEADRKKFYLPFSDVG